MLPVFKGCISWLKRVRRSCWYPASSSKPRPARLYSKIFGYVFGFLCFFIHSQSILHRQLSGNSVLDAVSLLSHTSLPLLPARLLGPSPVVTALRVKFVSAWCLTDAFSRP